MNGAIKRRARAEAEHIIATGATVRACAGRFGVSKTTVHKDMRERLPAIDPALASRAAAVMRENLSTRHLRGGEATRRRYMKSPRSGGPGSGDDGRANA